MIKKERCIVSVDIENKFKALFVTLMLFYRTRDICSNSLIHVLVRLYLHYVTPLPGKIYSNLRVNFITFYTMYHEDVVRNA